MRHLRLVCLTLVLALLAAPVHAIDDFGMGEDAWYGLQSFVQMAESLGISVDVANEVDWTQQPVDEPIIIVYPRTELDGNSLAEWVSDGGRVLLLDDFGASESFLERLSVTRVVPTLGSLPHSEFADNLPSFPVFRPQGKHPLLEGVSEIVANHPSVITNDGGPVVGYTAGGALVYDMNLGDGKAVLVADASIFINQMLDVADNSVFAGNALDYLCRAERPCRTRLLVGDFKSVGTYGRRGFDAGDVKQLIGSINQVLNRLGTTLPGHELLFYLSLIIGIGLAAYLTTVFPMRRMRAYSAFIRDFYRPIPEPQSEFDWNLERFGSATRRTNYTLPLSILKELFEELFLSDLGLWPSQPGKRPNVETMADMYREKYSAGLSVAESKRLQNDLLQLLVELTSIPPRNRVFLDSDAEYTAADLLRLHRRVMETLRKMGLEDDFKRRTRGEF